MAKIMNVNRRYPSLGQCPRPRLGEVAAPELAALDTDKDKAVRPIASEGVQVAPQLGDDQFGEDDRADARPGLGRALDELAEFVDRLGHPDTPTVQIKSGTATRRRWRARHRALRWGRPPGTGAPPPSACADQSRSPGMPNRCCTKPSSSPHDCPARGHRV